MKIVEENMRHLHIKPPNETDVSVLALRLASSWQTEVAFSNSWKH